jgi:hypothetical protein
MAGKSFTFGLFTIGLLIYTLGCSLGTTGTGSWEIYTGVRTEQIGEQPPKITIESTVVDKIIDSFTDGKVTKEE